MNPDNNGGYNSSEELQRANHDAFVDKKAQQEANQKRTEKDRLHKTLDKYIAQHKTVDAVRERLKKSGKTISGKALEVQFEVSDELVKILEKIKNELR